MSLAPFLIRKLSVLALSDSVVITKRSVNPINKEVISNRVRAQLDFQNRHKQVPFYDCVSKVTVSKKTNNLLLKRLDGYIHNSIVTIKKNEHNN